MLGGNLSLVLSNDNAREQLRHAFSVCLYGVLNRPDLCHSLQTAKCKKNKKTSYCFCVNEVDIEANELSLRCVCPLIPRVRVCAGKMDISGMCPIRFVATSIGSPALIYCNAATVVDRKSVV